MGCFRHVREPRARGSEIMRRFRFQFIFWHFRQTLVYCYCKQEGSLAFGEGNCQYLGLLIVLNGY